MQLAETAEAVTLEAGGVELFRYVVQPDVPQLESPHPYLHPLRTTTGELVSLYRPHDHVWHKGISLALPNVDDANFWGGPTYVRDKGYVQLHNNGTQRHDEFTKVHITDGIARIDERLSWITEQGEHWIDEKRRFGAYLLPEESAWVLTFETALHNRRETPIQFGSPTTEGRPAAGYGGFFWRGPRSFNNGKILAPDTSGEALMGQRAEWLGYVGKHDEIDGAATIVFVDNAANVRHPTQWFVRSEPYACVCPAPFFDEVLDVAAGDTLTLRYDFLIGSGSWDPARIGQVVSDRVRGVDALGRS
jgi:hypothetical protein